MGSPIGRLTYTRTRTITFRMFTLVTRRRSTALESTSRWRGESHFRGRSSDTEEDEFALLAVAWMDFTSKGEGKIQRWGEKRRKPRRKEREREKREREIERESTGGWMKATRSVTRDRVEKERRDSTRVKCHARLISPWEVRGLAPARPDLLPPAAPFLLQNRSLSFSLFLVVLILLAVVAPPPSRPSTLPTGGLSRDEPRYSIAGTSRDCVVSCRVVSCRVVSRRSQDLPSIDTTHCVFDNADAEKRNEHSGESYAANLSLRQIHESAVRLGACAGNWSSNLDRNRAYKFVAFFLFWARRCDITG